MSRKSLSITLVAALTLLILMAGIASAQTQAEAKQKYEELIEQVRTLDQKMKAATPEEYETLLAQRKSLVQDIGRYKGILEGDQETKKMINDVKRKYNEGTTALKLRRYSDAVTNFQECVNLGESLNNPIISDVIAMSYYQMGQAFKMQRNWAKLRDSMQSAVNTKSDYERAYFELGYANERLGRTEEAEQAYSTAKQIDPTYDKASFNLGVLYYNKSHYDRAIQEFMSVIEVNPTSDKAFTYMGRAYFDKKDYGSAQSALEKALELNPKDYEAPWFLAQTLNKSGQYSRALDAANTVINLRKSFGGGYFERGLANKGLGRKPQALADFEQAKKDKQFRQLAEYQIKWYDK